MPKKIPVTEINHMRSQLRTIITFATNLEARFDAFLDGMGAVPEKPKKTKDKISKETILRFHKSLKVKN